MVGVQRGRSRFEDLWDGGIVESWISRSFSVAQRRFRRLSADNRCSWCFLTLDMVGGGDRRQAVSGYGLWLMA